jgi:hypothetical protein
MNAGDRGEYTPIEPHDCPGKVVEKVVEFGYGKLIIYFTDKTALSLSGFVTYESPRRGKGEAS